MQRGRSRRVGVAVSVLMTVLITGASPALAAADAAVTTADGPVPWTLTAECSVVAGTTTTVNSITFVIKATAHAEGPAIGTQVGCSVYKEDGVRVGGCNGVLIGPFAACTDRVVVPIGDIPTFCVTATSLYATGIAQMLPCSPGTR